ncbi:hypothetical protein [Parahaliea aestuarii]|uniref:Uncharacterized protein n=1 Tax=Parahaliea aestuarii TaxID=1852021 RepID=A0A5C8ZU66_9GAMM|nr:hypothetical protein [Parahaliea aestuarii]TXS91190.1 hypothetical protein FVW59_13390 [Parahaliea aestuarii]
MRTGIALRLLRAGAMLAGLAAGAVQAETLGFVLSSFTMVTPGAGPEDCPEGFNKGYSERFLDSLPASERQRYAENQGLLYQAQAPWYYENPEEDPCANPGAFPDPGMYTIDGPLSLQRMEPDGSLSQRSAPPAQCPATDDFTALAEGRAIDNQYWRVMGCVRGYQPTGQAAAFANSFIFDGSTTMLLEVDMPENGADGPVALRIASSDQPVSLGTDGQPLPWRSFNTVAQERFHNSATGVREGKVIATGPFDLRLIRAAQRLDSELYLRDARLRLEIDPDSGEASGYLAGYWDLEWLAHASIRIQDRTGRSSGKPAADTHGYTCPGKYYALQRLADGHPDPASGNCTSISVLHSLRAVPAFVLDRKSTKPEQADPAQ